MGKESNDIIIYKTENGDSKLDVRTDGETVWLTQSQMAELFQRDRSVISKHIKNVFDDDELEEKSNVQNLHIANSDKPVKTYIMRLIGIRLQK